MMGKENYIPQPIENKKCPHTNASLLTAWDL
jgi:hypothetical protein